MIESIIFDMGGVFVSDKIRDFAYKEAADHYGVKENDIRKLAEKYEIYHDLPNFSGEEYWNRMSKDLGINKKPKDFWIEKYIERSPIDWEVHELIKKLKKNEYYLAVLSNTIPKHLEMNKKRNLFYLFDSTIFSCDIEVNSKKPERKIYEICLERIKFPPEKCVFIDDKLENLVPAKKLGIETILYENLNQLRSSLRNLGVYV